MSNRRQVGSAPASNALYTQFCIGVELGDDTLVRDLVQRGANTMVSYGVDGVITTPMRSALVKGDLPMVQALLSSRSTRIHLADLESAPHVKPEMITPILVRRMVDALEHGAKERLLQTATCDKQPNFSARASSRSRNLKVSLRESIARHLHDTEVIKVNAESSGSEAPLHASNADRPRCPPGDPAVSEDDEESADDNGTEQSSMGEEVEAASIASSAEDSSVDGNL